MGVIYMIAWSDDILIGLDVIDQQHREIFSRVQKIIIINSQESAYKSASENLVFLMTYVKEHLSAEEKLMEESTYPRLAEHKELHARLLIAADRIYENIKTDGITPLNVLDIESLLMGWFKTHILTHDKDFAEYLKQ